MRGCQICERGALLCCGSEMTGRQPRILSAADLRHFEQHGYVVARAVISPAQAARTAAEAWRVAGRDALDPATWSYEDGPSLPSIEGLGGLESARASMTQTWNNRTAPRDGGGARGILSDLGHTPAVVQP